VRWVLKVTRNLPEGLAVLVEIYSLIHLQSSLNAVVDDQDDAKEQACTVEML